MNIAAIRKCIAEPAFACLRQKQDEEALYCVLRKRALARRVENADAVPAALWLDVIEREHPGSVSHLLDITNASSIEELFGTHAIVTEVDEYSNMVLFIAERARRWGPNSQVGLGEIMLAVVYIRSRELEEMKDDRNEADLPVMVTWERMLRRTIDAPEDWMVDTARVRIARTSLQALLSACVFKVRSVLFRSNVIRMLQKGDVANDEIAEILNLDPEEVARLSDERDYSS